MIFREAISSVFRFSLGIIATAAPLANNTKFSIIITKREQMSDSIICSDFIWYNEFVTTIYKCCRKPEIDAVKMK